MHRSPEVIQIGTLAALPRQMSTLLIGVDGPGGAGKSIFARALASVLPGDVSVVEMDDFFRPSMERQSGDPRDKPIGADFDWQRLREQVLQPLAHEDTAQYQRYDWDLDRLAEWHAVAPGGIVIVEGVYTTRAELAAYYDYTIWMECPRATRLARGIARSGEAIRPVWERDWMVAEDLYIAAHAPDERATLVIDSSGVGAHDRRREVVVLRRGTVAGETAEQDRLRGIES
ncbi:MAG TPA: hypothetical protein VF116_17795 [Ktedonobacterales bacterium]